MRFLLTVGAIVRKDILAELRTRELLISMLLFAFLILVILNFALNTSSAAVEAAAPGVLWVTFTFAGVLGLNRSFLAESENGCLEGMLLAPVDRGAIYLGKMLANLIFMAIAEAIVLPVFAVLYKFPVLPHLGALVVVLALGVGLGTDGLNLVHTDSLGHFLSDLVAFAVNLILGLTGLIIVLLYLVFLLLDYPTYAAYISILLLF